MAGVDPAEAVLKQDCICSKDEDWRMSMIDNSDNVEAARKVFVSRRQLLKWTTAGASAAAIGLVYKHAKRAHGQSTSGYARSTGAAVDTAPPVETKPGRDPLAEVVQGTHHAPGCPNRGIAFDVALTHETTRLPVKVAPGDVVIVANAQSHSPSSWLAVIQFRNHRLRESIVGYASISSNRSSSDLHPNTRFVTLAANAVYEAKDDQAESGATYRLDCGITEVTNAG
jgi:hypothetical protein